MGLVKLLQKLAQRIGVHQEVGGRLAENSAEGNVVQPAQADAHEGEKVSAEHLIHFELAPELRHARPGLLHVSTGRREAGDIDRAR